MSEWRIRDRRGRIVDRSSSRTNAQKIADLIEGSIELVVDWTAHPDGDICVYDATIYGLDFSIVVEDVDGENTYTARVWYCDFPGDRIDPPSWDVAPLDETQETYPSLDAAKEAAVEFARVAYEGEMAAERQIDAALAAAAEDER